MSEIALPAITVVGSLNVDHTLRVAHLPAPGETVTARSVTTSFGGKGANQAVAAARAGGRVRLIGCVGGDDHGARYLEYLGAEGIDSAGVVTVLGEPTGSAVIAVDDAGENSIVVNPGANHCLGETHLKEGAALIEGAAALLLQLECPLGVVKRAAQMAHAGGVAVILNPSPWLDTFREAGVPADVLILNESEARSLTGRDVAALGPESEAVLAEAKCAILIVTRGADPTLVIAGREGCFEVRPPAVIPVDTVGAGDTFAGAFAVAHSEGTPLGAAVEFANAAAALATLRAGTQDAIPHRDEIREFAASTRGATLEDQ